MHTYIYTYTYIYYNNNKHIYIYIYTYKWLGSDAHFRETKPGEKARPGGSMEAGPPPQRDESSIHII